MKLTKTTMDLVCELEQIIGSQCYNPNSLYGLTTEEREAIGYIDIK